MIAKILKTSDGAKKAWLTRVKTTPAGSTAHADSIPRNPTQERAHQKELASPNWHTKTIAAMRDKSNASLAYIRRDALAAAKANPTGHKAGQYADEASYAAGEAYKRQQHSKSKG